MKNKILFLVSCFLFVTPILFAQDRVLTMPVDPKIMDTRTWADSTFTPFTTADNIIKSKTYSIMVNTQQPCAVQFDARLSLDSIAGTPDDVTVTCKGRVFTTDDLSTIATYVWSGSTSDTTLKFSNKTTTKTLAFTLPSYGSTLTTTSYTTTVTPDVSSAGADSLFIVPSYTITATNAAQSVTGTFTDNQASEYYREIWFIISTNSTTQTIRPRAFEIKLYRRY